MGFITFKIIFDIALEFRYNVPIDNDNLKLLATYFLTTLVRNLMINSQKRTVQPSKSFDRLARLARAYRKTNLRRNTFLFVLLLLPALTLLYGVLLMAHRHEFGIILFIGMVSSAVMLAFTSLFFKASFTDASMLAHLPRENIQKELDNPFNDFTKDEKRYFHLWLEIKSSKPTQGDSNDSNCQS